MMRKAKPTAVATAATAAAALAAVAAAAAVGRRKVVPPILKTVIKKAVSLPTLTKPVLFVAAEDKAATLRKEIAEKQREAREDGDSEAVE